MLKNIPIGKITLGLVLSFPTLLYWYYGYMESWIYPGYNGSHLRDMSVFLAGIISFLLFIICTILAMFRKQSPAFLVAAIINSTPTLAFLSFWAWLILTYGLPLRISSDMLKFIV